MVRNLKEVYDKVKARENNLVSPNKILEFHHVTLLLILSYQLDYISIIGIFKSL